MLEMKYASKSINATFGVKYNALDFDLKKPMLCPYCNAYEDGSKVDTYLFNESENIRYGIVRYRCTHCQKIYLVVYTLNMQLKEASVEAIVPSITIRFENQILQDLSPRFIDMYNQALAAESAGSIELAAIGFRASLEILVKDYAVQELNQSKEEVAKKHLVKAIEEYLKQDDLLKAADVVRILGNDYAHYERKYPEHDFELLKSYMQIFLSIIQTQLMIKHPPVSRP